MGAYNAGDGQVLYKDQYEAWIRSRGVGSRNPSGGSIGSYVSRLMRVSRELRIVIGPTTVSDHADTESITNRLVKKGVNKGSAADCSTALKHYADMVEAKKLV